MRLWERDDHLSHLIERPLARQRFPSPTMTMAAKGCTTKVAAKFGQTSHDNRILIVQTFD